MNGMSLLSNDSCAHSSGRAMNNVSAMPMSCDEDDSLRGFGLGEVTGATEARNRSGLWEVAGGSDGRTGLGFGARSGGTSVGTWLGLGANIGGGAVAFCADRLRSST